MFPVCILFGLGYPAAGIIMARWCAGPIVSHLSSFLFFLTLYLLLYLLCTIIIINHFQHLINPISPFSYQPPPHTQRPSPFPVPDKNMGKAG